MGNKPYRFASELKFNYSLVSLYLLKTIYKAPVNFTGALYLTVRYRILSSYHLLKTTAGRNNAAFSTDFRLVAAETIGFEGFDGHVQFFTNLRQ